MLLWLFGLNPVMAIGSSFQDWRALKIGELLFSLIPAVFCFGIAISSYRKATEYHESLYEFEASRLRAVEEARAALKGMLYASIATLAVLALGFTCIFVPAVLLVATLALKKPTLSAYRWVRRSFWQLVTWPSREYCRVKRFIALLRALKRPREA